MKIVSKTVPLNQSLDIPSAAANVSTSLITTPEPTLLVVTWWELTDDERRELQVQQARAQMELQVQQARAQMTSLRPTSGS